MIADMIEQAIDKRLSNVFMGMVARVESFDAKKMTAEIQPLLERDKKKFALVSNVPVQFIFAGGFYLRPEYKKGDLVWIAFSQTDMDAPLSDDFAEIERENFNMQNCVVVSGIVKKDFEAPESFDKEGIVIGKDKNFLHVGKDFFEFNFGDKKTTIDKNGIKTSGEIKAEGKIETEKDIKIKGKVEATGDIETKGKIDAMGDIEAKGKIDANGEITSKAGLKSYADVTALSSTVPTKLLTHMHATSAPGAPTAPPTPGT